MNTKIKRYLLIFFCGFLFSQQNILLDKVSAVVDDKIVLLSDVVLAANALAAQENINPSISPKKYNDLLLKASESMIEQLVIIKMAEVDSVTVLEKDVEKALERISKKKYGDCEICEKPIPVNRLDALPYTTSSKDCANLKEA